jgi:N-acetylglucosaminyldiphosphoundecaprenol N-acetyl-beta-D-mannosaminyltransferase
MRDSNGATAPSARLRARMIGAIPSPRRPSDGVIPPIEDDGGPERDEGFSWRVLDLSLQVFSTPEIAARRILAAWREDRAVTVFTCNVDHVMLTRADPRFREAYRRADLVTMDGAPVALLSRWTGATGARRVTGVDVVAALAAEASRQGLRMAVVGGEPGRAELAGAALAAANPGLPEVVTACPPVGFALGGPEDDALVEMLRREAPRVVVACFGAPKQELWMDRHRDDLPGAVLIGAGATVDYLSGAVRRAPAVFQQTGTEAFYRLATDFRRLWRRYLLRDSRFVGLFALVLARHLAQLTTDELRARRAVVRHADDSAVTTVPSPRVPDESRAPDPSVQPENEVAP